MGKKIPAAAGTTGGLSMMTLHDEGIFLVNGALSAQAPVSPEEGRRQTMAWNILQAHNTSGDPDNLKIRFDAMLSHDITYVGIIQQARASGMKEFPIPYALTNCHNSLCAVGGTINEDDHVVCPLPRSTAVSMSLPTRA